MIATPHIWDTRLTNWRKILQKYQNQTFASSPNNLKMSMPLRRVKVMVLKAMSQQGPGTPYNNITQRRLEEKMIRAIIKQ